MINKSKYETQILFSLLDKEPKTISELQRDIGISYKETYRHLKILNARGFVKGEKQTQTKHSPVFITLTEKGKAIAKYEKDFIKVMGKDGIKDIDKIMSETCNEWKKTHKK
jgi:DNA-binding MarR family transcriptional regulator